jgi:hypothetical protein
MVLQARVATFDRPGEHDDVARLHARRREYRLAGAVLDRRVTVAVDRRDRDRRGRDLERLSLRQQVDDLGATVNLGLVDDRGLAGGIPADKGRSDIIRMNERVGLDIGGGGAGRQIDLDIDQSRPPGPRRRGRRVEGHRLDPSGRRRIGQRIARPRRAR